MTPSLRGKGNVVRIFLVVLVAIAIVAACATKEEPWSGTASVDGLPGQLGSWSGTAECKIDDQYPDVLYVKAPLPATANERAEPLPVTVILTVGGTAQMIVGGLGYFSEVGGELTVDLVGGDVTQGDMIVNAHDVSWCVGDRCLYEHVSPTFTFGWDCSGR